MRIEIEIPKEFEEHFNQDKFKDTLERIMADIKHSLQNGDCLCAGRYEYETIEMLEKAFENSRQAYNIDKFVEELETMSQYITFKDMFAVHENVKMIATDTAIEFVKHGGVSDDVCEWKDKKLYGYYTSCTSFRGKVACKDTYWKYCPFCSKKIKVVK